MSSILYSNAVISSHIDKLLNTDKVKRMIHSPSEEDAIKILLECGYNENLISSHLDRSDLIINDELKRTVELFKELCTEESILKCVMAKYDYNNAKTIYKSTIAEINLLETVYDFGSIKLQKLKDSIIYKRYSVLPQKMKEALVLLNEKEEKRAKEIDFVFKEAMYKDIVSHISNIKTESVQKYFRTEIDFLNLETVAKYKLYKTVDIEQIKVAIIEGGLIPVNEIMWFLNSSVKQIESTAITSKYREIIEMFCKSLEENDLSIFEDFCHSYLIRLSKVNKDDVYSISFLFNWFIVKLEELKIVKFILLGKRHNLNRKQFRDCLKGAYEELK